LEFARAWLRRQRPDPRTHGLLVARQEFDELRERIILACLPSHSIQLAASVVLLEPENRAAKPETSAISVFENRAPGWSGSQEIAIWRELTSSEMQLMRILFGDQWTDELLGLRDEPEPPQVSTSHDAAHGIIERCLPAEYHHIFRANLRWLADQLRAALNREIDVLLLAYMERVSEPTGPQGRLTADVPAPREDAKALIERAMRALDPLKEIDDILFDLGWNRNEWARAAGVDRTTVYRWFKTGKAHDQSRRFLTRALDQKLAALSRDTR
jgi:hypothetical protein